MVLSWAAENWPYHAMVMKMLEMVRSRMVVMEEPFTMGDEESTSSR